MTLRHAIMRLVHDAAVSSRGSSIPGRGYVWSIREGRTPKRRHGRERTIGSAGFTMVELMVVVIIISVVAALTIPNITRRMQERRASEAAQRVALIYQTARTQAMGRGTAVLVRYRQPQPSSQGIFEVREAQRGPGVGAGCALLPVPSCTSTNWNDFVVGQYHELTTLNLDARSEFAKVRAEMKQASNNAATAFLDVCFTPMGRTFVRQVDVGNFVPLTAVYKAEVFRAAGTTSLGGRLRSVMILPNGGARLQ